MRMTAFMESQPSGHGGMYSNAGADMHQWASGFQSEVLFSNFDYFRLTEIDFFTMSFFHLTLF